MSPRRPQTEADRGAIRRLPVLIPPPEAPPDVDGSDHPVRAVTRAVAADEASWTAAAAAEMIERFDELAPDWPDRLSPEEFVGLPDACERGLLEPSALCLEVGSGTGFGTVHLAAHFRATVAVDISAGMLALASPDLAPRVRADGASLPLPDDSVDVVALINMLLFPSEVDRVLRPDGAVLWFNTLGVRTPIHLPAEEVAAALPGRWQGIASEALWATWCVLRRAAPDG
ncbi:MAG: class I SAM-dependent methyltransferase [bacterium]|nr:class I SAM-dependent methyltransferase [bacterium]